MVLQVGSGVTLWAQWLPPGRHFLQAASLQPDLRQAVLGGRVEGRKH